MKNEKQFRENFDRLLELVAASSTFQSESSCWLPVFNTGEEGVLGLFRGVTLIGLCGARVSDFCSTQEINKIVLDLPKPEGVTDLYDPINKYGKNGESQISYYGFQNDGSPAAFLDALEKRTVEIAFDCLSTSMGTYNPTPALPAASPPSPTLPYENLRKRQETPGSPQKSDGKKPKSVREKKTKSQLEEYLNGIVDDGGLETSRTPMKVSETDKVTRSDSRDAKLIHTLLKLLSHDELV